MCVIADDKRYFSSNVGLASKSRNSDKKIVRNLKKHSVGTFNTCHCAKKIFY